MPDKRDLLIEIGTEELPPKALNKLSQAFSDGIVKGLEQEGLTFEKVQRFATPRRLAVLVSRLALTQPDRILERRGPALNAAFGADGRPSKAAEGFARSCGVTVEQLERLETDKGAWLVFKQNQPGRPTAELIPGMVERSLADLPIPKRMRWGDREDEFVRPIHWVVLLFCEEVIDCKILGQQTSRATRGHRFHNPTPIGIPMPAQYPRILKEQGMVIADFDERRELIRRLVTETAEAAGARAVIGEALLEEVTALNEWPVPVMGSFEARFLEVPPEVLIETMQDNQKYFPVVDAEGRLRPNFITIANIQSRDIDKVRAGNERVIRPRFSDAAFFWEQDLKRPLAERVPELKTVVFQERLGTLFDKTQRVANLAVYIAGKIGLDPKLAYRAGELCKADLMTKMVFEFPSLQGIMGRYYAAKNGEHPQVAQAMDEVYMPRHAGDALPASGSGQAVAIADRLDTLIGIFAIGQRPSGVKDPFALRRAALGVLRTLIETPLELDLEELLKVAAEEFAGKLDATPAVAEVFDFVMERLKAYYADRGIAPDVVDAVLACRPTRPADFDRRIRAVSEFRRLEEAETLAAANKRIRNILKKTEERFPDSPDPALFQDDAERELFAQVEALRPELAPLFAAGDYSAAMKRLATLRAPVDRFFDQVMVMCEDGELRRNRLALLNGLSDLFLRTADISRLQGAGEG
jgi:glycyl-tRNA synthetase beta chain